MKRLFLSFVLFNLLLSTPCIGNRYVNLNALPASDSLSSALRLHTNATSDSVYQRDTNKMHNAPIHSLPQQMGEISKEWKNEEDKITLIRDLLNGLTQKQLVQIPCSYRTRGLNGDTLTCSGVIVLPRKKPIKNIILVSHYTLSANHEIPSQTFPLEGLLANKGYAIVVPDYIGFGASTRKQHPYLHPYSTAKCVVDMALAAKKYLTDINHAPLNDSIILMGYSQGAAATLAVQQLIEKRYNKELPILINYVGAGPYDITATYDHAIATNYTGIAPAIPMIVQGMNVSYNLHLDLSQLFKDTLLQRYDEWINSKKYSIMELRHIMGIGQIDRFLTPQAMDKNNPMTARLYQAMRKSSMTTNIHDLPHAPIYLFHSYQDDVVPFVNAEELVQLFDSIDMHILHQKNDLYKVMHNQDASYCYYDFGKYGNHRVAFSRFLNKIYGML